MMPRYNINPAYYLDLNVLQRVLEKAYGRITIEAERDIIHVTDCIQILIRLQDLNFNCGLSMHGPVYTVEEIYDMVNNKVYEAFII